MCTTDVYLGVHIRSHQDSEDKSDSFLYAISGNYYVKNIVANVNMKIIDHFREFDAKKQPPFITGYRPDLDTSG